MREKRNNREMNNLAAGIERL